MQEAPTDPITAPPVTEDTVPRRRFRRTAPNPFTLVRRGIAIADEDKGPEDVMRRDAAFRRLLALGDVFAAGLALELAVTLLGDDRLRLGALLVVPVVVLISKIVGLYDRDELVMTKNALDEVPSLFQLSAMYALTVWLAERVLIDGQLDQHQVALLWATMFASMIGARYLARKLAWRVSPVERCLVAGEPEVAARISAKLAATPQARSLVVGRVALSREQLIMRGEGALGSVDELERIVREHRIHRVLLAPEANDSEQLLETVRTVKGLGVKLSLLPRVFEVIGSSVVFDQLDGMTMLGVRRFGLTKSSAFLKRSLDMFGAGLGLLALAPVFAAIALAIKLDSRGTVLFRQRRIGRDGRSFDMLKFRSMVPDAEERKAELVALNEADGLFKIAADPRITRVGRLIRKTSLDELPQLLNVLRGQMSLVGPRPLIPAEDERLEGWHRRRLHLTPGMTGHWQILGSARIPLHEMAAIDYLYIANWSLWADVKILLRTVPHVIRARSM